MYSQYRTVKVEPCLPLPAGTTPPKARRASSTRSPPSAWSRRCGAKGTQALVHTAAASNLGQMLNRICLADGIALVNIVRKPEQAALLREQGARHVVQTRASPRFIDELTEALVETGATLAFDAIGGGKLAGQILGAMEAALNRTAKEYSRYGSTTHKQVYIYGGLDTGPTEFVRNFGMAWGMGGWLLFPFLQRIGADARERAQGARRAPSSRRRSRATTRAPSRSRARCRPKRSPTTAGARPASKVLIDPSA